MHVLIISGSRNPEGRTAGCAGAVARGLARAGATSEAVFLTACNLERCHQCDADGWGLCLREGRCIIEDDFASLVEKIVSADVVVFANPVYFSELSESMRAFLDRLRRISYRRPEQPLKGKPAFGVCMAGSGGGGAPFCCFSLERVLRTIGFSVVEVVPVRRQNIDGRLPMLETAGERLAAGHGTGSRSLNQRLGSLTRWIISVVVYLAYYRLGPVRRMRL